MAFVGYHPQSPFLIPPTSAHDFYNEPMAVVDFLEGDMEREVVSQVTFRNLMNSSFQDGNGGKPQKVPFYVFSGLEPLMESLSKWGFTAAQLDKLEKRTIDGTDQPLVPPAMMKYLRDPEKQRLRVSISSREEGSLAFPHEPLLVIKGPKWQVDMIEAAADNLIKNHTKWATIAAEFWLAAEAPDGRRPALIDGSLRRASDWPALGPARSSYIAGWAKTSNEFAGELYNIPTGGTLAHSFYMSAADEVTANRKWLRHMPPASLPDSRNTSEGMDVHLQVCKEMGLVPASARNDSDDPEWFINEYTKKMKEQGFDPSKVNFSASNSLSAPQIYQMIHVKNLAYNSFIIGTHLGNQVQDATEASVQKLAQVTGYDNGVKVEEPRDVMKIAAGKSSWPGVQDTIHMYEERPGQPDIFRGSVIVPQGMELGSKGRLDRELISMPHPKDGNRPEEGAQPFLQGMKFKRANVEVMRNGVPVVQEFIDQDAVASTEKARARFFRSMASLAPQHKQLIHPVPIGFGVEESLFWKQSRAVMNETLRTRRHREVRKLALSAG